MRRAAAICLALCLTSSIALADCSEAHVHLRGDFGEARFSVEIADDVAERAQGLMFRESLPASSGMLFLYDSPQLLSFWMRNTLIELDMLFLDAQGRVQFIHDRAQPGDETPITGGEGVAVLEINGGLAKRLGITVGAELQHPFFGKEAAWACG